MYLIPRMCAWHGGVHGYSEFDKPLAIGDTTDGFCSDCANRYIKNKERNTTASLNYAKFKREVYLVNRVRVNNKMMERKKLYTWEVK